MSNEFTAVQNQKWELDKPSKEEFMKKLSLNMREVLEKAGYDPTSFLKWNGKDQNWYFEEQDLLCWFYVAYPNGVIQTEKSLYESGTLCQYKVTIYKRGTVDEIPTVLEGPVILRNDNDFYTGITNFVSTARTMAIANALRHCGVGCQASENYTVIYPSAQAPSPVKEEDAKETKQPYDAVANVTVDMATNCFLEYDPSYGKRRTFAGKTLGELLYKLNKGDFLMRAKPESKILTPYTYQCIDVLMNAAQNGG